MIIHNIKIENFKSLYGVHTFDFDKCKGLIKLSGPIGSGKTSLAEAIIWGLFGTVKGQNNGNLISWNEKYCAVEINLTSKGKDIHIIRNIKEPLIIEINGKTLAASNKRDTQSIFEEELLDVPKLAIIKMCIISFNQFNSLANMNPGETKQFLDEIFGFKLFSDYNDKIILERKNQQNENIKLQALYQDALTQIDNLTSKKAMQTNELASSIDIDSLNKKRESYIEKGKAEREKQNNIIAERNDKKKEFDKLIREAQSKMSGAAALGKQAKEHYNTFKSGVCPTCGQKIDESHIAHHKDEMNKYAAEYREWERKAKEYEVQKANVTAEYQPKIDECTVNMDNLRKYIGIIDSEIKSYNDSVKLLNENYDELINDQERKAKKIKEQLDKSELEICEWNDMNILFTKTLRYNLLETLIPHINKSIQFFINKLDQSFKVEYDQEFKAHIYVEGWDREITYNNLSTGQKKTLDLAIIFGILQNIVSTVDMNIIFLDELFSNMDADTRNIMLTLLNETMSQDKSIFIVNHAEMADDCFKHKIRVRIENKKMTYRIQKEDKDVVIKCSRYSQEF